MRLIIIFGLAWRDKGMANESKKDFNAMMNNNKDMPKIKIVEDEKTIKKYGGTKMFFAPPIYYDELMKKVPKGKLVTVSQMRDYFAKQNKAAFLCGTTNLSHNFIQALKSEKEIPVFCAPNVSIGVFLFSRLLKEAVQKYQGYNFALHEEHHAKKKDAPSGTAKSLAAFIGFPEEKITYERKGKVPGTHSLTITSCAGDEEILLQHKALDRNLFASSAVKIARWLVNQKGGFYTMENFVK